MNFKKTALLFAIIFACAGWSFASAANIFITQSGSPQGACTTNVQTPAFFNNAANWGSGASQIGPGTIVHICGTFTALAEAQEPATQSVNTNILTAQGSGASGNPVTILFDTNAQMTSPAFGADSNAAIVLDGSSFLTVDGGTNGVIQNTNNKDTGLDVFSTGISAKPCNNCEIRNLSIVNIYVHPQNGKTHASGLDQTLERAIDFSGSNWSIHDNTIHDCGWCLFQAYDSGDTNTQIFNNNVYNMDHGWALATSNAAAFTSAFFHDNHFHDTANWDASGCPFHHDGIHTFGTSGSSIDGLNIYNNLFDGNWGQCPTGYVFIEGGGSSTPSHLRSMTFYNNVILIPSGAVENTNSWVDIASGESGAQRVFNNTFIGPNNTDNTLCIAMQNLSSIKFENNAISNCGDPVDIDNSIIAAVDHNFYGTVCGTGNCFIFNGSFTGNFAFWQQACHCDAGSIQNASAKLNIDGSPLAGSPVLLEGLNLASLGLTALTSDTSKGNTRTPIPRPSTGAWTTGAYQAATGAPNPPTNVVATPH